MIRTYFNEKAVIWDETVAEKDTAKLERMAENLNIKPGSVLLDVGTGTGVFVPYLLKKIGKRGRLVTLDVAEEMLKRARTKNLNNNNNIECIHADVINIPLRDEIFDIVVCYSSFPHFQDKPTSLSEISRVLKNGSRLVICHTSSRAAINGIHRQIPAVQTDIIPDEDEMQALLSSAGFIDIDICDHEDSYLASAEKSW